MEIKYEIHGRIFKYVVKGLSLPKYLPKSVESQIIIKQYVRSLTSVGANDNEADGAASKRDFIHLYSLVRKELKETLYWLRIISELYTEINPQINPLIQENQELIRIVSAIITNTVTKVKYI